VRPKNQETRILLRKQKFDNVFHSTLYCAPTTCSGAVAKEYLARNWEARQKARMNIPYWLIPGKFQFCPIQHPAAEVYW
jgi:hypothetical protein